MGLFEFRIIVFSIISQTLLYTYVTEIVVLNICSILNIFNI